MIVVKEEAQTYKEYYDERKKSTDKKVLKDRKRRRKEAKRRKTKAKLKFLRNICLMFLVCIFILNRYTKITHLNYEVSNLDNEIAKLNKEKENLEVELDSAKNAAKIEKSAKLELGMDYPTPDQVVYVDVEDVETKELDVAAGGKFNVVKYFKNMVNKMSKFF